MLLELSQVLSNVLLIEFGALVVFHRLGNGKLEVRRSELVAHLLHKLLDLAHLAFDVGDLSFLIIVVDVVLFNLLGKVISSLEFLNIAHTLKFEVVLDLVTNFFILFVNHVNIGVKRVDIVEERVVLLFGLDECGNDFFNGADTSGFFDLVEGVLNNLNITGVHVHECAFFSVLGLPSLETGLHKSYGVSKLLSAGAVLNLDTFGLGLFKLAVIAFLKLLLQVENLVLKSELVNLVLSLEGKDLIVGVLAETLAVVSETVDLLDVVDVLSDLTVVSFVDAPLVAQLLSPGIDLLAERLVLRLEFVKLSESLVTSILEELDLVLVL